MPRQSFHHTAVTSAALADVFAHLQQAQIWGEIAGTDSTSDERLDDRDHLESFSFVATVAGRAYPGKATVTTNGASHIATTIDTSELGGVISVDLEEVDQSTAIHVTLDAHSKSFVAGLAFGAIARSIGNGLGPRIERLARSLDR